MGYKLLFLSKANKKFALAIKIKVGSGWAISLNLIIYHFNVKKNNSSHIYSEKNELLLIRHFVSH